MHDHTIYKFLRYIRKHGAVLSSELLNKRSFRRYGEKGLEAALNELYKLGMIYGKKKYEVIHCRITPKGECFVEDYKYSRQLKNRERFFTFLLGIVSGYILTYFFPWLHSFLP